ncbi:sulfurtransferase TusA family protein [Anaerobacillus isosaccharinicus]|uniref:OsmC family protein n=1 Tax=Anaerobacillus isosaccharinicus TaxID=1532552 RepID=A0A1S2M4Q2_9BACI|nr:OsmC family protein [Anaerobacillus isosaccharinicus]MBA5587537.1 OsmC family protein [Anaerobacillus isosaccharinicus]QOY34283.1 OsmC family protein [Anaerobacillus isosaccharinicus]
MVFQKPDGMCDGGDLDCGSGLLLIIKKSMDPLEPGQLLEVRSRERTVADDLPAWCRMVEHEFLGFEKHEQHTSYYVRKGGSSGSVEEDLEAARGYQWSVRVREAQGLSAKVFSRNHTLTAGQPAEFSQKVDAPSAIDYLLTSLGSCLVVGFKAHASKRHIVIDEMEITLKGKLENILYHMELEDHGSPKVEEITGIFYVTSPNDESELEDVWRTTIERSPIYQTLLPSVSINLKFQVIL